MSDHKPMTTPPFGGWRPYEVQMLGDGRADKWGKPNFSLKVFGKTIFEGWT